jgi:pimeloyl-ACP methyl ester carboxylesterase
MKMNNLYSTSVDGVRIAYDVVGHGSALMLLHGMGKTRRDWFKAGYVQRLQEDFTVITPDLRGSGESDQPLNHADYAIEKICEDLYAVADACAAPRFAVWGFSFGGNVARYLAAWSGRVTALALVGVSFGPAVDAEFDRYIDQFAEKYAHLARPDTAQQRKPSIKQQIPAMMACFQAMRSWPSVAPGDVRCPTLLLVGTKNKRVLDWVQANRGALKEAGTRVEILPGLTHNQEFSKIDAVFPATSSFLREHALEVRQ